MRRAFNIPVRSFAAACDATKSASDGVVILSACRTPLGAFSGKLSKISGPKLGAIAVKEATARAKINPTDVDEVLLGTVIAAGMGQAPATQASIGGGLPNTVPCTSINKVCSSGMKTIIMGAQSILTNTNNVVMTGGFESMSNIPYYLAKARTGYGYGHGELLDGVLKDGLWDAFDDQHMGSCAEVCAKKYGFTREQQDDFAIESYRRANLAIKEGLFKAEMIAMPELDYDERPGSLKLDKVRTLKPAFQKEGGTVTAANASSLNDGAAALVLASGAWAEGRGLKPMARVIGWGDAQQAPVWFTTAPALAVPIALRRAGLEVKDVDYWEINEAFSAVALANNHLLKLDPAKVNVNGGAVALGHPIGSSGARIVVTLLHVLQQRKARIGVAAICNGGGGASCVVVENLML